MTQKEFFPGIESKTKKAKQDLTIQEWTVPSFTSDQVYIVRSEGSKWSCNCPYFTARKRQCKHITFKKQELGLIKPDMTSAKSAIQKALRRGDLPLLKLAFSNLWEKERKWLCWRLPILTSEENWKYTGWAGRIGFVENPQRDRVWSLLASIALNPKDKDAEGMRLAVNDLLKNGWPIEDWIEPERVRLVQGWIDIKKKFFKDRDKFWESITPQTDYADEIVRTCKRRRGGMIDDQELLGVTAYLACATAVEQPVLDQVIKEEDVEVPLEIPWWSCDFHTSIGKIAQAAVKKMFADKDMAHYVASDLWFNCESSKCDRLVEHSYFWPLCLKLWRHARGKTEAQVEADWGYWGPKIKALVEKSMRNQHV
jgi:hypothetical protein